MPREISIAVRSSVAVKQPKEVAHRWFKGANEELSASLSWEPAMLTSSIFLFPACSQPQELSWAPTKDSEPQAWFRRFPGAAKVGHRAGLALCQTCSLNKAQMSMSILCSWQLSTACGETGMLKNTEFHTANIKDLQCVLRVKKPDSAAESTYELWITLYLMMLNCICHLAAKSLTVFISIWGFSLFSRAFPNWKDSATLANFP